MEVINCGPEPDQDLIDCLDQLLNEARAGEIQSIAYVVLTDRKDTGNGWSAMNKGNMVMIAELDLLKQELINEFVDMRNEFSK